MTTIGTLFNISAPSGAGKTSLVKALMANMPELKLSISHTTRPMRSGEEDGQDYFFIDKATFKKMIAEGAFLEHADVFGNYYGTSQAIVEKQLSLGHDVLLEIDWQGAAQIRERMPHVVSIFILPPSLAALEERLAGRGQDSEEVIARRLSEAINEISHYKDYDYLIINDNFEVALKELAAVVLSQQVRLERQQHVHKTLIQTLLG
ncbi:MAG TPA: guanylate kinase [Gammaproteobacteria bacterium]|nr:guanylate kinase [Gammaproteobacteria bacterium]